MSVRAFETIIFFGTFTFAVIIILFVLALFFKNSKLKIKDWFQIETEAKDCKFKNSNKELEDHLVSNAIENDSRLDYLRNKSIDDIKNNYKDINTIKNRITELNIYKEYCIIIFYTTLNLLYNFHKFLGDNHIAEKTPDEIKSLASKRTKELIKLYDDSFKNSTYPSIQQLTVEKIAGNFYYVIKNLIKDTYDDIYDSYDEKIKERKDEIDNYVENNPELESMIKVKNVIPIMDITYNKISKTNFSILSEMSNDIINILLGLFYDKLKE